MHWEGVLQSSGSLLNSSPGCRLAQYVSVTRCGAAYAKPAQANLSILTETTRPPISELFIISAARSASSLVL